MSVKMQPVIAHIFATCLRLL